MAKELAKVYDPSEVEDRLYDFWLKGNYFHAEPDPLKKPYTIVIPPPNITGQLHMGHALDNTLQDILIPSCCFLPTSARCTRPKQPIFLDRKSVV